MKPRSTAQLAIVCATGLIALAMVLYGVHGSLPHGKAAALLVLGLSLVVGTAAWSCPGTSLPRKGHRPS